MSRLRQRIERLEQVDGLNADHESGLAEVIRDLDRVLGLDGYPADSQQGATPEGEGTNAGHPGRATAKTIEALCEEIERAYRQTGGVG